MLCTVATMACIVDTQAPGHLINVPYNPSESSLLSPVKLSLNKYQHRIGERTNNVATLV